MKDLSRRAISATLLTSLLAAHCAAPLGGDEDPASAAPPASSTEDALAQTGDVQKVSAAAAKVRAAESSATKAAAVPLQAFAKEISAQKGDGPAAVALLATLLDGSTLTPALRADAARDLGARHGGALRAALAARGDAQLADAAAKALGALGGADALARANAASELGALLAARGVLDKATAADLAALPARLAGARSRFAEQIVADASAAILASLLTATATLPDPKATALIIPLIGVGLVLLGLLILFPATGVLDYCAQKTVPVVNGDWWTTWPGGSVRPDSRITRVESLSPPRIGVHSEVDDSGDLSPATCITGSFDTGDARLPQIEVPISTINAVAHAHASGFNYARARNDWSLTLRDVSGTPHCVRDWNVDEAISMYNTRADVDASGWPSSAVLSCSLDHDLPAGRYHVMVCTRASTYTSGGTAWATSRGDVGVSSFRRCPL